MYRRDAHVPAIDGASRIVGMTSAAAMSLLALVALVEPAPHPVGLIARAWLVSALLLGVSRALLAWARRRARMQRRSGKPTIIVGTGRVGSQIARRLRQRPELGLVPIGFLDIEPQADFHGGPVLGTPAQLTDVVTETRAEHVIFSYLAGPGASDTLLVPLLHECENLGVEVSVVPRLVDTSSNRVLLDHLGGLPLFAVQRVDPKGLQFMLKHAFDRTAAAISIVLLAPLLAALALGVRLSSPGPILFRQFRVGRDGQEFAMFKFRSMSLPDETESAQPTHALPPLPGSGPGGVEGRDRRTRFGSFIRSSSLDELPQLFNVLRGDMSLVGPRPERPEYVALFGQHIHRYTDRHRVKSGITGWAQVHGLRGQTHLADRVDWDNYYIENWSLWLDFRIMLMTVGAVTQNAE
jgi:exopolysaccharide biosynthesis polyprenyl glycosylphosphotransferase